MDDTDLTLLLQKIANGDQFALAALYDHTSRVLFGLVLQHLDDTASAEEVLLDIYTQVWRQAGTYDPKRESPLEWLRLIARTRAIDRLGIGKQEMEPGAQESEPPLFLRDLLLARVERELPAVTPSAVAHEPAKEPHPPPAALPPRLPFTTRPKPAGNRLPWIILTGLAVAALVLFFSWRKAEQEARRQQEKAVQARVDTEQLQAMLELERGRARELEQINAALSTPGMRVILLSGQPVAPSASAAVFLDPHKNELVISGYLPPAPVGKVYRLWLFTPNSKVNAGAINTDAAGHSFTKLTAPNEIAKQLSSAGITLESENGSAQPTMPIYALGKIGS